METKKDFYELSMFAFSESIVKDLVKSFEKLKILPNDYNDILTNFQNAMSHSAKLTKKLSIKVTNEKEFSDFFTQILQISFQRLGYFLSQLFPEVPYSVSANLKQDIIRTVHHILEQINKKDSTLQMQLIQANFLLTMSRAWIDNKTCMQQFTTCKTSHKTFQQIENLSIIKTKDLSEKEMLSFNTAQKYFWILLDKQATNYAVSLLIENLEELKNVKVDTILTLWKRMKIEFFDMRGGQNEIPLLLGNVGCNETIYINRQWLKMDRKWIANLIQILFHEGAHLAIRFLFEDSGKITPPKKEKKEIESKGSYGEYESLECGHRFCDQLLGKYNIDVVLDENCLNHFLDVNNWCNFQALFNNQKKEFKYVAFPNPYRSGFFIVPECWITDLMYNMRGEILY